MKNLIVMLSSKISKPIFIPNNFETLLTNLQENSNFVEPREADLGIEYKMSLANSTISKEGKIDLEVQAFNYIKKLFL